jgi:hypothetical protein
MKLEIPIENGPDPLKAPAENAPRPTYAPFFLALGITMLFWGLATSPVMSAGGFAIFVWALWMWIREIARGWRN